MVGGVEEHRQTNNSACASSFLVDVSYCLPQLSKQDELRWKRRCKRKEEERKMVTTLEKIFSFSFFPSTIFAPAEAR